MSASSAESRHVKSLNQFEIQYPRPQGRDSRSTCWSFDDLGKLDGSAEAVTRKLVQYFGDVLEDDRSKLAENLLINNKDIKTYVTKFQWEGAKYPLKQSLKVLSEIIGKQVTQIDNDLKQKSITYNNLKNSLASIDRKTTGSLITKDLADIVKADDFVLNSEYLQTLHGGCT
ncbi:V-type proton ATPase subunit C [Parelaphostrongylus tenuis]|uniref:V-type proton ATPase subunit C n=1 Tax=Parelaphostrongylus tenuis TaxID=148309 RepID=A0AAD5QH11_PARTN|nr:V-type proton ATPase subunit C [Parelaphostrongylus tenuis]